MKWLFRKSKSFDKPPGVQERVAERFVNAVLMAQRKTADRLNRATSEWSGIKMRLALYFFCLVFGGGSTIVLISAIRESTNKSAIPMPAPVIHALPQLPGINMEAVRKAQVKELEAIQHRLDSLPADSISPQARAQFEELKKQILNP